MWREVSQGALVCPSACQQEGHIARVTFVVGASDVPLIDPLRESRAESFPLSTKMASKNSCLIRWAGKIGEWSRQLGIVSTALLFHMIERQLAAGQSLVAESAFSAEFDVPRLQRMQGHYHFQTLEVCCTAQMEVLLERFAQRAQSAERHPGHGELDQAEELRAKLERGVYAPLSQLGEALIVDTLMLPESTINVSCSEFARK